MLGLAATRGTLQRTAEKRALIQAEEARKKAAAEKKALVEARAKAAGDDNAGVKALAFLGAAPAILGAIIFQGSIMGSESPGAIKVSQ